VRHAWALCERVTLYTETAEMNGHDHAPFRGSGHLRRSHRQRSGPPSHDARAPRARFASSLFRLRGCTMFASEQCCSESNIIACFYCTKLYLAFGSATFERSAIRAASQLEQGLPGLHTRARLGALSCLARDKFRFRITCWPHCPVGITGHCCPSSNWSSWPSGRLSMNPSLRFGRSTFATTASSQCWVPTRLRRSDLSALKA
jgi:hypothetical protein